MSMCPFFVFASASLVCLLVCVSLSGNVNVVVQELAHALSSRLSVSLCGVYTYRMAAAVVSAACACAALSNHGALGSVVTPAETGISRPGDASARVVQQGGGCLGVGRDRVRLAMRVLALRR